MAIPRCPVRIRGRLRPGDAIGAVPDIALAAKGLAINIKADICIAMGGMLFDVVTAEKFVTWECEGGVIKEDALAGLAQVCAKL